MDVLNYMFAFKKIYKNLSQYYFTLTSSEKMAILSSVNPNCTVKQVLLW